MLGRKLRARPTPAAVAAIGGGGNPEGGGPKLTSPTGTATSDTEADLSVSTNRKNGTLYWVVTTSSTAPTKAQVKAGNDHNGTAAADSGSQAVTSNGTQNITGGATGLTAATAYFAHFMHEAANGQQSAVATSSTFTTEASGFAPSDLGAALVGWYRGDTLTGSDGDPIATWPDASGNSDDMTQATSANRPTLETAGLNSLNVVRFTAADSEYMLIPPGIYTGATAASAYLVIKLVADPAAASSSSGLWRIGNETGASASCHFPFTDGNVYDGFASTARKSTGNPTADLSSTYRIVGFHSAANDWGLMVDGVSHFATATNTVGIEGSSTALGRSDDGLGNFFYLDARVAEAVFTNAKQSEADRQKIEGYLAHKWGLTANLDSGHPYKSSAP